MVFGNTVNAQVKPLDNWDLETLAQGEFQNESYFSFSKRGSFRSFQASPLVRYSMRTNFELQLNWTGSRTQSAGGNITDQTTRVGIKAFLNKDSKYLPGFSVIGSVALTTNTDEKSFSPALNILFRKGITSNFTLTGNYQFVLDEQEGDLGGDYAVNLDVFFTKWLTSYVGIRGFKSFPLPDVASTEEYLEIGSLIWIADGFRLYPYYDIALSDNANDIFTIGLLFQLR